MLMLGAAFYTMLELYLSPDDRTKYILNNMEKLGLDPTIKYAVIKSGIKNFTGEYQPLGGGEVNNSFLLDLGEDKAVLRVSRDSGIDTLHNEARALGSLNLAQVPKLLYFDNEDLIDGKNWILESYVPGHTVERLTVPQFRELGKLLATVHNTTSSQEIGVNAWSLFLRSCKLFGDEAYLLSHPDVRLRSLITKSTELFKRKEEALANVRPSLIHSDATPSNILVDGDSVGLIDWEFAKYSDPLAEFSTIFYEDTEYNLGKWRIKINDSEREALYKGYQSAGGSINIDRIKFWMIVDKLGASVFLYWRLNVSDRELTYEQVQQYAYDYNNLLKSVELGLS